MNDIFINKIHIKKVRHLEDITIDFGDGGRKHMIFTGQNGSGKTSVLEAIRDYLEEVYVQKKTTKTIKNIAVNFNVKNETILETYDNGEFILAYFPAKRMCTSKNPTGVKKVDLKNVYGFQDNAAKDFLQYIVSLRAMQSFARENGEIESAEEMKRWFISFEKIIQNAFEDQELSVHFDWRNLLFRIAQKGREKFDFTTLSEGYSALLSIVIELMLRMEKYKKENYDIQGIVLIDEISTHLHLASQKTVLPFLMNVFPNIQFIISTHSPFVLSSVDNAVIYDLENRFQIEDLSKYPYDGIVEGYFKIRQYVSQLKDKLNLYEQLIKKASLTAQEKETMYDLRFYLMKIPEDLAPEIAHKYEELENIRHSKSA